MAERLAKNLRRTNGNLYSRQISLRTDRRKDDGRRPVEETAAVPWIHRLAPRQRGAGNFIARRMNTVLFRRVHMKPFMRIISLSKFLVFALLAGSTTVTRAATPPAGFTALFNGTDLTGWRGGDTFDHRKYLDMPEDKRAEQDAKWTEDMKKHWSVQNGEFVNDGHGKYATTTKDYGDFELLVDYKTVPKADSGIYLRGVPQVQIWDYTEQAKFSIGADKGSGGLWNNSPGTPGKDPLVLADKPFGEWNSFRILMVGSRVSIWLNGKLVVDHANMENYYDRKKGIPAKGPHPTPDPRRRDSLAQRVHPRDRHGRGEQDSRVEGRRRVQDRVRRQGSRRLGRAGGQLRNQERRGRVQGWQGRHDLRE